MSDAHAPVYLVFGDLHGRILPAFRLAACWAKDDGRPVVGILQVGDLGYFPDPARIDRATLRHAEKDPLELGTFDIIRPNEFADHIFDDQHCPLALWFTAGNHEDFDELERLAVTTGRGPDFPVDAYGRVRGIKDGHILPLPDGPRVGAVWGVDRDGPNARTNLPRRGYIWPKSVDRLLAGPFDVLLSHDAPAGAKRDGYGSEPLRALIGLARPAFAFFGHYRGDGARAAGDFGRTEVYHLAGLELGGKDGVPTTGSVGVLEWGGGAGRFEYVPGGWLRTFTRHNWKWR